MAELAPEVQLPSDLTAEIDPPEFLGQRVSGVDGLISAGGMDVVGLTVELLLLRIELADGFAQDRTSFQHARSGLHEGEILVISDLDQPVQRRIAKRGPPVPVILASGLYRR